MKEEVISFELSQLAKEKGFIHMKSNCYGDNLCYQLPEGELINALQGNTVDGYILAPSQSLLQKWLRDFHNIEIVVRPSINQSIKLDYLYGVFTIYSNGARKFLEIEGEERFPNYESSLEAALFTALKLI